MLLRLAYLGMTNAFAVLCLLPMNDRDKNIEILALRHQITVLERQLGQERARFAPADRAFLAALLHRLPRNVLRWHRSLVARRHAALSQPKRPNRPRTVRSGRAFHIELARRTGTHNSSAMHRPGSCGRGEAQ
ncbi:hypothetical protein [Saccharopolyspora shandongensis]|uniref:hypothetical protein n=1 Tax=Saccharopolyspora shandongensis TaxID=418495 RepID=UPI000A487AC0|nr:hypothetical protein [Saccharopolyspora shandongensis]